MKHLFHDLLGKSQSAVPQYGKKTWETVADATVSQAFFPYLRTTV